MSGVSPNSWYEEAEQGATDSRMCLRAEMHRQTWTSKQPCPTGRPKGPASNPILPRRVLVPPWVGQAPLKFVPSQAGCSNPT